MIFILISFKLTLLPATTNRETEKSWNGERASERERDKEESGGQWQEIVAIFANCLQWWPQVHPVPLFVILAATNVPLIFSDSSLYFFQCYASSDIWQTKEKGRDREKEIGIGTANCCCCFCCCWFCLCLLPGKYYFAWLLQRPKRAVTIRLFPFVFPTTSSRSSYFYFFLFF